MDLSALAVVAALALAFGLLSGRISNSWVSAPILFVTAGALLGPNVIGLISLSFVGRGIDALAAVTLVLILFCDAARIDVRKLPRNGSIPLRLLVIALPLTVGGGALTAWLTFDRVGLWDALLLGAILAPTDAALGQAVVTDERVPARIRHALNVESGLNDGICVPLVWFLLAAAGATQSSGSVGYSALEWSLYAARSLTIASLLGALIGWGTGRALELASKRGWVSPYASGVPLLAAPLLTFGVVEQLGASGFIAAFVCGLFAAMSDLRPGHVELPEQIGTLGSMVTWGAFGALFVAPTLTHLTLRMLAYGLASLTVVRLVPVALSVVGLKLRWESIAFVGWFGPRGLASVVFGILLHERTELAHHEHFFFVTTCTVVLSVLLHGVTAGPLSAWYGRRFRPEPAEATEPVAELWPVEPVRPHCVACERENRGVVRAAPRAASHDPRAQGPTVPSRPGRN